MQGETRLVNFLYNECEFSIAPGSFLYIQSDPGETHQEYMARYKRWFHANLKHPEFKHNVHALKGRTIGVFQFPESNIGEIVKHYLDSL